MKEIFIKVSEETIVIAPKILISCALFLVFWLAGQITRRIFCRIGDRFDEGKKQVFRLMGSTCKSVVLILGGITALGTMGINVNALVAGLGLSGFALGFALKDALSNILAGALILIYKPFQYGDQIDVVGSQGEVIEINLRYTVLQGEEKKYLIPNSTLFTNQIGIMNRPR